MKFQKLSDKPETHTTPEDIKTGLFLWGPGALPQGGKIVGVYTDIHKRGALIQLPSGKHVCGAAGSVSTTIF